MARSFVGIDIGNANLKIASIRKSGKRYVIESVVSEKLGAMSQRRGNEFNTQGCAAIVKRLIETNRISASNCILGLNGKDVIFRFVEIPPVSDGQIRKLLEYEQAASTKGISAEMMTDYQQLNIPRETPGSLALVGTARAADLDEDVRLLTTAKLKVSGIVPKSVALHRLMADSGVVSDAETTMLLDIGEEATEIVIALGRNLVLARTVNIGGRTFTEAIAKEFSVINEVAEEIKLAEGTIMVTGKRPSLMSEFREGFDDLIAAEGIRFRNDPRYPSNLSRALTGAADQLRMAADSALRFAMVQTKVKNLKIDKIILSGGGSKLPGLLEYFNSKFNIPVQYWDVMGVFDTANVPPDKRDVPTEFANALALAYIAADHLDNTINLIPEKVKEQFKFWASDIYAYAGIAIFLAGMVLWWFGASTTAKKAASVKSGISSLDKTAKNNSAHINEVMAAIKLTTDRVSTISKESYFNPLVLKFMHALQTAIPETVLLSDVQLESVAPPSGVAGPGKFVKPEWQFVVKGYVNKDVPELQQPNITKLLGDNISKLPFVVKFEIKEYERIDRPRKSKGSPITIEAGSYRFAMNFIVSENGELRYNEIKP